MKLYTGRINFQSRSKTVLNTTIQSGKGLGAIYQPTWEIVKASKNDLITWEEYTERYKELMREQYLNNYKLFMRIFGLPEVVVTCYCADTSATTRHCHRYILVDILSKVATHHNISCEYCGEIK